MTDLTSRIRDLPPGDRAALRQRLWERGLPTRHLDPDTSEIPASFTQRRMVFLHRLNPSGFAYHSPMGMRLLGRVDPHALESALNDLLARHDALRTVLPVHEGEPVQRVLPFAYRALPVVDLTSLPAERRRREADRLADAEQFDPFDLTTGPLVRFVLIHEAQEESTLLLTFHHAVFDGWSISVLGRELGDLYGARLRGEPSPPPRTRLTYGEYARWQRDWAQGEEAARQLDHWERRLSDARGLLELPLDRRRPARADDRGDACRFVISPEVTAGLGRLAQRSGATLFMVLLAGFQALLARYSGQEDIIVGTAIANRRRREFHDLIGFFANSLALRSRVRPEAPFADLLAEVRATCLDAYDNQDIPLDLLAKRLNLDQDLGRNPLYQVNFTLHNTPEPNVRLPGVTVVPLGLDHHGARFDLDLNIWETPAGLECRLIYATGLFDATTAAGLTRSLCALLGAVAEDPTTPVGILPLGGVEPAPPAPAETHPLPRACLHELFAAQARATPDAVAVSAPGRTALTYRELDRLANGLAHRLRTRGAGRRTRVAVLLPRSPDLVVALLGVLKAGAAYVPLDPAYPRFRLDHMLRDSGAGILITDDVPARLNPGRAAVVLASEAGGGADEPPRTDAHDGDLMYLMYTSGSTGGPKGAMLSHRNVVNYLLWAARTYHAAEGAGVPVHSSVSFDLTVTSLFAPLLAGQRLVLVEESEAPGEALVRCAHSDRDLSFVKLTPSHLRLLDDAGVPGAAERWTRTLVIGGEDLREEHLAAWRGNAAATRLFNEYGPTETAVAAAAYEVGDAESPSGRVPIGAAVPNTRLHVLDAAMRPVPPGVPGELYIGGAGVGHGYWNRAALTAERFVPDPFSSSPGARLYRTGDLARRLDDGNLEYLGRRDEQVKIRGHRVEPAEIASVIESCPGVRRAWVGVDRSAGTEHIVALVTPEKVEPVAARDQHETHLDRWRTVYQDVYADLRVAGDVSFNLAGWTSSYSDAPVDPGQMALWLDRTVERIRELRPRRVLEIGCGTGMITARVAPGCERYRAVDLSPAAIDYLVACELGDGVDLQVAPAHLAPRDGEGYDTVILNSVVQYFPSAAYLLDVLERALASLVPGGRVFIGDVRDLALLETFHTSVYAHRADAATPVGTARAEIRRRLDLDKELCLDPRFFTGLPGRWARLGAVRVLPKRGRHPHELSGYRYDVVLTVREEGRPEEIHLEPVWRDWASDGLSTDGLERLLADERPSVLALRAVPNARIHQDVELRRRLADAPASARLGGVLAGQEAKPSPAVDPDLLWEIADRYGYHAELSWARGSDDGSFDAVLSRAPLPAGASAAHGGVTLSSPEPAERYANDPLWWSTVTARLPEIEEYVRERLPAFMTPSRYVPVSGLPLTGNGKLDHHALRGFIAASAGAGAAPPTPERTLGPTERKIAAIWSELLSKENIGPEDDFFDLGGHSLLTFQLVFRLRQEFEVEIPIRAPFDASTLAGLSALVDERRAMERKADPVADGDSGGGGRPEPVRVDRDALMPASFAQERLWFVHRLDPDSPRYNYPIFVRLRGELDVGLLEHALDGVIRRHEVLRTVLVSPHGRPFQSILPHVRPDLRVIDVAGDEQEAARLALAQYGLPFDLSAPPVVRTALVRLTPTDHVLLLTVHHLTVDAWAEGLLMDEIAELYTAAREGRPPRLPEPPVQYADYAVWQRRLLDEGHYDEPRAYWRRHLDGILDLPEVPADRPRPARPAHPGRRLEFRLDETLVPRLRALCREEDGTLFMALLTALHVLLRDRTGSTDVVVGSDVANRQDTATERLIGFFVNQIVLRSDVSGGPTWRELLRRTRRVTLDAYAHQDLPFEEVVKALNPRRGRNRNPLFQVKIVLNNTPSNRFALPGVTAHPFELKVIDTSRFDLTLLLGEDGDGVTGVWEYDAELFDAETIQRMRADYLALVRAMAETPDDRAGRPGAAPEPERSARPSLKRITPTVVTLDSREPVTREPAGVGAPLTTIRPARPEVDVIAWATASRDELQAELHARGAILFRGFSVVEPARLERLATVFVSELYAENGEHPRARLGAGVYTPVFFPPERKLLWHNENSFNDSAPSRIWFACRHPADEGGETPIADSRAVHRRIDPDLRAEFTRKRIQYVRTYGSGPGRHWRDVFGTGDRHEVEDRCRRQGLRFSWHGDRLRTSAIRPAVLRHPVTGEWSWFNQAQHWHPACLDEETRSALLATFGPDDLPRDCRFGDGSPIPDAAMEEICRVYRELEVCFPWERGDVLMLDNILVAHARNPFRGRRELLVAMGGMVRLG